MGEQTREGFSDGGDGYGPGSWSWGGGEAWWDGL